MDNILYEVNIQKWSVAKHIILNYEDKYLGHACATTQKEDFIQSDPKKGPDLPKIHQKNSSSGHSTEIYIFGGLNQKR